MPSLLGISLCFFFGLANGRVIIKKIPRFRREKTTRAREKTTLEKKVRAREKTTTAREKTREKTSRKRKK